MAISDYTRRVSQGLAPVEAIGMEISRLANKAELLKRGILSPDQEVRDTARRAVAQRMIKNIEEKT